MKLENQLVSLELAKKADKFGVSRQSIGLILQGKRWV